MVRLEKIYLKSMLSCHFQQGLDLMDSLGWVFGDAFSPKSAQHCTTAWGGGQHPGGVPQLWGWHWGWLGSLESFSNLSDSVVVGERSQQCLVMLAVTPLPCHHWCHLVSQHGAGWGLGDCSAELR